MKLEYLNSAQAAVLRSWWQALQPQAESHGKTGPFAMLGRADRAKLRRCAEPEAVVMQPAFQRLVFLLDQEEVRKEHSRFAGDYLAYAVVAGILSHVKTDAGDGKSFAESMGTPFENNGNKGKAPLSELRFQRLQTCANEVDFYRQAIRSVKLLRGNADVASTADDLLAWVRECRRGHATQQPRDSLKFRWANDYYRQALQLTATAK